MFMSEHGLRLSRRCFVLAVVVFGLGGLFSGTAEAAPNLVQSTLVNGSRFEARPFRAVLTFSEPLVRLGVGLSRGTTEIAMNLPTPGASANEAYIDFSLLDPGQYALRWIATGADGSNTGGVLRFSVLPAPASQPATTQPATTQPATTQPATTQFFITAPPATETPPTTPVTTNPTPTEAPTPPRETTVVPPATDVIPRRAPGPLPVLTTAPDASSTLPVETTRPVSGGPPTESTGPPAVVGTTDLGPPATERSTSATEAVNRAVERSDQGTIAEVLSAPVVVTTKTPAGPNASTTQRGRQQTTQRPTTRPALVTQPGGPTDAPSDAPTTIAPVKDPTEPDPFLEFQPQPGRRPTTIVLAPDGPLATRSDGSPLTIALRTIPTTTRPASLGTRTTAPPEATTTTRRRQSQTETGKRTVEPNRFDGLRSGLAVVGLVALIATLATSVSRRTPRALRILLVASSTVALGTVALVSLLGIADELMAIPRETVRFVAKIVGALAFFGAATLRYFVGDRTLPRRHVSMHLRTQSIRSGAVPVVEHAMSRFRRIALGQIGFSFLLVISTVLLMSR